MNALQDIELRILKNYAAQIAIGLESLRNFHQTPFGQERLGQPEWQAYSGATHLVQWGANADAALDRMIEYFSSIRDVSSEDEVFDLVSELEHLQSPGCHFIFTLAQDLEFVQTQLLSHFTICMEHYLTTPMH